MFKLLWEKKKTVNKYVKHNSQKSIIFGTNSFLTMSFFGLYLLIYIKNMTQIQVPSILYLFITLVFVIYAPKEDLAVFLVSIIPLTWFFQYKYAVLIVVLGYYIKSKQTCTRMMPLLFLMFLMVIEILHMIVSEFSFIDSLRFFAELIAYCLILSDVDYRVDYWRISRMLSLSSLFTCIIILVLYIKNFQGFSNFFGYMTTHRLGNGIILEANNGTTFNPNSIGFICVFPIVTIVQKILANKARFFDIVITISLAVIAVLTMSIKVLLLFATLLLLVALGSRTVGKKMKNLLLISCSLIFVFVLWTDVDPDVLNHFRERLTADDITNGRSDLISIYFTFLLSYPLILLFGVGGTDYYNVLVKTYHMSNIPHNGIQELFVMWGLSGTIIIALIIIKSIQFAREKNKTISLINWIPIIILCVYIQGAQFLFDSKCALALILCYASLLFTFNKSENEVIRYDEKNKYIYKR